MYVYEASEKNILRTCRRDLEAYNNSLTDLDDADERVLVDDGRVEVAPGHALHDPLDPLLGLRAGRLQRPQEALQVPRGLHAQPEVTNNRSSQIMFQIHPVWFIRDTLIKDIVRIFATSRDRVFSYQANKGQKTIWQ